MIRFGIAGFGLHAAQRLMPGFRLARKCKVTALSRRNLDMASASATHFKIPLAFDSIADLCRSNEVDAVMVTTPNAFHYPDVLLALECGKPVLCEKPMGINADECRGMIAAAEKQNLLLGVAQMLRFDEGVQSFREKLKAGEIGRLNSVRAEFSYSASDSTRAWINDPKISGGGPIADVGVHCIDALRFILDDEVAQVCATASSDQESGDVEARATLNLEFRKGTLATVSVSMRSQYRVLLEFVGEAGKLLSIDDGGDAERSVRAGLKRYLAYSRQVDAFADALEHKIPFPVSGEEGLKNQLVLDAAYRSLRSGRVESTSVS